MKNIDNNLLMKAYEAFYTLAEPLLNIDTEDKYQAALSTVEHLMSAPNQNDQLAPLLDLITNAIEQYELKDSAIATFVEKAESIPAHIALLSVLMDQHQLGLDDLPEIGDGKAVKSVLDYETVIPVPAAVQLGKRFGLPPENFNPYCGRAPCGNTDSHTC